VRPPPIGLPITWHRQDADVPGVVIRVASTGTLFWFRTEGGNVYRATTALDGRWREDSDCWPVTLGVARSGKRPAPPTPTPLDELLHKADRLEPWLLKRRWYPMSYMMIPGVLSSAQQVAEQLEHWQGSAEEVERARQKGAHLRRLLTGFRRLR
jgi:hypothetical protein